MKLNKTKLKKISYALAAGIAAILTALGFCSCGVTKATISKPAEGTSTTITITTNNPIQTEINPNVTYNKE